ncbi:hypothetical protein M378DRAFT_191606 [Amanita muscaria Koide BX008]|uniref:Uncharacterized protein n=1 Tax=Amanita muscaria (strain Koide BX008) TaxID=946122 RepID=A0A0C2XFF8_AMAMK|nr:hypothetical protein M378DRAFT_191606 [Amanita muscaria Koide BX008]
MRSVLCVATTLLAAASVYAQSFTINTPSNVVVCQPLLIQWSGGTAPYFLSVLPGNSPSGQALESLGTFNGTSFSWKVNIAAGTSIDLTLRDSNGNLAQSAAVTINPGSDTSCVGQAVSGSAGTATATPPATSGSAGGTTAGTTTGTQTTNAGTTPSSTGTGSSASSSKTNGASPANVAKVGTAGIIGAALAVLLA